MKALKFRNTALVLAAAAVMGLASCGGDGYRPFIKASERNEMKALWQTAFNAGKSEQYDPAAYLKSKGYSIANSYTTTTSAWPQTADVLATYRAADTEQLCNTVEGLVEYDRDNPASKGSFRYGVLLQAYESGELEKLGIDWKPNKQ